MSYDKNIENYTVKFKDEVSYLNCRLDFLGHCRFAVMPEVNFIQFIQNKMYDSLKCEIESIESIRYSDIIFDSVAVDDYTTYLNVEGNPFWFEENSSWTTPIPASTIIYTTDSLNKVIKKVPPDDPIDSRFDILDL